MLPNMVYEKTKETFFDGDGNAIKVNSYTTAMHKSKTYDFSLVDREEQKKLQYKQSISTTKYQQAGLNCFNLFAFMFILISIIIFAIYKFEIVEHSWIDTLKKDLDQKLDYWKSSIIGSDQKQLKEAGGKRCESEGNGQDSDCSNEIYQL